MTSYTGFGESLNKVLNELEELKNAATLRAKDIARHECSRHESRGCADSGFALSYKNVLAAHRFVGNFDVLKEAAKALGYEFILWNGKVYWACGAWTIYTEKDIQ